jgi:hypothetical protein
VLLHIHSSLDEHLYEINYNCHINVNFILPTQLPHKFSYIVAILIHNDFESPNTYIEYQNTFGLFKSILQNNISHLSIALTSFILYLQCEVVPEKSTLLVLIVLN